MIVHTNQSTLGMKFLYVYTNIYQMKINGITSVVSYIKVFISVVVI